MTYVYNFHVYKFRNFLKSNKLIFQIENWNTQFTQS